MTIGKLRVNVNWGHLLLIVGFAAFVVWYYEDAQASSVEIENTILIVPTSLLALAMCVLVAIQTVHIRRVELADEAVSDAAEAERGTILWPVLYMVALGVYVFLIEDLGFDVTTALFLAVGMLISGEKRPLPILAFSVIFAAVCVYALKAALPLDFPTFLFG